MDYFTTYTGENIFPLNPDINQIHIEDIAHALSLLCRAGGHFDYFYSVAQHSVNCAGEAKARKYPARIQLACLLHDASEAYISDIIKPIKTHLPDYLKIEQDFQNLICTKFLGDSLCEDEKVIIKQIDDNMLINEFNALMTRTNVFNTIPILTGKPSFDYRNHQETETEFLKVYYGIMHAGLIQGR